MNDNKENSQLLPFHKSNDRTDNRQTIEVRDELGHLLHKVQFPGHPEELDRRILSSYADQIERRPLWKRMIKGTIPIPIPVAAMIVLSISLLMYFGLRPSAIVTMEAPKSGPGEQIRIVEVPVVKEHVVRRTVYINQHFGLPGQTSNENRSVGAGVDLGGFKPVEEFKVRLLEGDGQYEK